MSFGVLPLTAATVSRCPAVLDCSVFVSELDGSAREIADLGRRDRLDTGPNGHTKR